MDTTVIRGLAVSARIGVHAWEQGVAQTLRLDLELGHDASAAGQTDSLADALDYEAVAARLVAAGAERRFQLLEAFAEHLAALLLAEFNVSRLRLAVWKPGALPGADTVGLVIERGIERRPAE